MKIFDEYFAKLKNPDLREVKKPPATKDKEPAEPALEKIMNELIKKTNSQDNIDINVILQGGYKLHYDKEMNIIQNFCFAMFTYNSIQSEAYPGLTKLGRCSPETVKFFRANIEKWKDTGSLAHIEKAIQSFNTEISEWKKARTESVEADRSSSCSSGFR